MERHDTSKREVRYMNKGTSIKSPEPFDYEKMLKELSEIKKLLQIIVSNQEQNQTQTIKILLDGQVLGETLSSSQKDSFNRILTSLSGIAQRLYSIEEKADWVKNGGKYLGDARGPSGVPGL